MSEEDFKLIQMRLRPDTVHKVEDLQNWLGVRNKTAAVRAALDLAHMLIEGMHGSPGSKIIFESEGGTQHQVAIPGLSSLR